MLPAHGSPRLSAGNCRNASARPDRPGVDGTDFERFPQHEKQPEKVKAEKGGGGGRLLSAQSHG